MLRGLLPCSRLPLRRSRDNCRPQISGRLECTTSARDVLSTVCVVVNTNIENPQNRSQRWAGVTVGYGYVPCPNPCNSKSPPLLVRGSTPFFISNFRSLLQRSLAAVDIMAAQLRSRDCMIWPVPTHPYPSGASHTTCQLSPSRKQQVKPAPQRLYWSSALAIWRGAPDATKRASDADRRGEGRGGRPCSN